MTTLSIELESFETDDVGPSRPDPEYLRGYEAGLAEAAANVDVAKAQAIADVSTTINDLSFGFAEARQQLLEALKPLLTEIVGVAIPSVLQESFGAHLFDEFAHKADAALNGPIVIEIPEHVAADLNEALFAGSEHEFEFRVNANLEEGTALITTGETDVLLDLNSVSNQLHDALLGLSTLERKPAYG